MHKRWKWLTQLDYDAIDRSQKQNVGGRLRNMISDETPIYAYRRKLAERQVAAMSKLAKQTARKIVWVFQQQGIKRGDLLVESNVYLNSVIRKYGVEPLLWDETRKIIKERMKEMG